MRLLALVTDRKNVERFLRHRGEPSEHPHAIHPSGRAAAYDGDMTSDPQTRQTGLFKEH
jgi:hypothetical protein